MKQSWKKNLRRFFRHRMGALGLFVILLFLFLGVFSFWIAPESGNGKDFEFNRQFHPPSLDAKELLGTDKGGRYLFGRICHGARRSLGIAALVVCFSGFFGIIIGAASGYFGGWFDAFAMRCIDIMLTFPNILLAITFVTAWDTRGNLWALVIPVGIAGIPIFARQVRASILVLKEQEYVLAAKALGAGHMRILFGRILPNAMGPIIVLASLATGGAILDVAGLNFLGLGADSTVAEWGGMLQEAKGLGYGVQNISVKSETGEWVKQTVLPWWVYLFPGLAIALTVLAFNLFGDALRDFLDPKLKSAATLKR